MSADPKRVEAIFTRALALPPADRVAFLVAECGSDDELRARVERLLAAHDELEAVSAPKSDSPATADLSSEPPTPTFDDGPRTEAHTPGPDAGTVIGGKYKLIEEIGEGGMGSVWMAQQTEPVKRTVAVKLIKAGMDSRAVLARFEAERQALAIMDHPNIAKVLDAGATPDGRPFFVMELVKGVTITKFCDDNKLTPRERLELFVPVCNAIQHAHQKGIIHRDIKPSNVLVALYDDRPVPKVIDFGVAKATGQQLTERTLATGFGAVVGTPEYMSPEQASFNNLDIDTRSDVYALGVLLYELLAGSPPFSRKELEKVGMLEIFRVIREQEPPRPSTKLSTAEALPSLSANRGTEPAKLTRLLRGELDWIVMKALEKDRSRRYESANGFAADVQRYLAGEQVQAVPPSVSYRLKKLFRRNRAAVGAASAVAVTLLVGAVVSIVFAVQASWHAEQAEKNAKTANDNADGQAKARQDADRHAADATASAKTAAAERDRVRGLFYDANMNLLQIAFTAQRVGRIRELLAELIPQPGEEDYRGFEWYHLDRLTAGQPVLKFSRPGGPPLLRARPDSVNGRWVVSVATHTGRRGTVLHEVTEDFVDPAKGKVDRKILLEPRPLVDQEVEVYDARTGQVAFRYVVPDEQMPQNVTVFDPGQVAYRVRRTMTIVETPGKSIKTFDLDGEPTATHWNPTGTRFFTTGRVPTTATGSSGPLPLKMWDAVTGKELFSFPAPKEPSVLRKFAFTPDGARVAIQIGRTEFSSYNAEQAGQSAEPIVVYDTTTGQQLGEVRNAGTLVGFAGAENHVVTVASGDRIGAPKRPPSENPPNAFVLWNSTTGERLKWVPVSLERSSAFAVSPDGRFAAVGRWTGCGTVYDLTGTVPPRDVWGSGVRVMRLVFAEGDVLVSEHESESADTREIWRHDLARPEVRVFRGSLPGPEGVGLTADGTRVMTLQMGSGCGVAVSDVLTGREVAWVPVGEAGERVDRMEKQVPVQFDSWLNRDGTRLLVHSLHDPTAPFPRYQTIVQVQPDGSLKKWIRVASADEYYIMPGAATPLFPAVPMSVGDLAVVAPWAALKTPAVERFRVWDVDAKRIVFDRSHLILPNTPRLTPTLSPDGRYVLLRDNSSWVVCDVASGAERCGERESNPKEDRFGNFYFAGDWLLQLRTTGRTPPTRDSKGTPATHLELRWWDLATGKQGDVQTIALPSSDPKTPSGFLVSPAGRHVVVYSRGPEPRVQLFAVSPTGVQALNLSSGNSQPSPGRPTFSPEGRWLTKSSPSGLLVWDLDTLGPPVQLGDIKHHSGFYAFSPDGRRLVTVTGSARVWDLRTGRELLALPVPISPWSVRFAGNRLVVASRGRGGAQACVLGAALKPKP